MREFCKNDAHKLVERKCTDLGFEKAKICVICGIVYVVSGLSDAALAKLQLQENYKINEIK